VLVLELGVAAWESSLREDRLQISSALASIDAWRALTAGDGAEGRRTRAEPSDSLGIDEASTFEKTSERRSLRQRR
jgi:hypothetical protein